MKKSQGKLENILNENEKYNIPKLWHKNSIQRDLYCKSLCLQKKKKSEISNLTAHLENLIGHLAWLLSC